MKFALGVVLGVAVCQAQNTLLLAPSTTASNAVAVAPAQFIKNDAGVWILNPAWQALQTNVVPRVTTTTTTVLPPATTTTVLAPSITATSAVSQFIKNDQGNWILNPAWSGNTVVSRPAVVTAPTVIQRPAVTTPVVSRPAVTVSRPAWTSTTTTNVPQFIQNSQGVWIKNPAYKGQVVAVPPPMTSSQGIAPLESISNIGQQLGYQKLSNSFATPGQGIVNQGAITQLPINTYYGVVGMYSLNPAGENVFTLNNNGQQILETALSKYQNTINNLANNPVQNGLYSFLQQNQNKLIAQVGASTASTASTDASTASTRPSG